MRFYLLLVALLHFGLMLGEMLPSENPILLQRLSAGLNQAATAGPPDTTNPIGSAKDVSSENPAGSSNTREIKAFSDRQLTLVSTIVKNAGMYNLVLAMGLAWAAWRGRAARELALVLLTGVTVVGLFGTVTLGPSVAVQASLGLLGVILVVQRWR